MEAALAALRHEGLAPRALWVSGLRDPAVQQGVCDLLRREGVQAVLCATSFASVSVEEAGLGAPLWEALGVPVLQLLTSGQPRSRWQVSSIGLGPVDLTLQVALPELDGRLTTRIGAFKEGGLASDRLATALPRLRPDPERLAWIAVLTRRWIELRRTAAAERRVALVLANYPTRNSRLANGVGLDTPESAARMLGWLAEAGYDLGGEALPAGGDALIHRLLEGRSNDPESGHRPALAHLPLACYHTWYEGLPPEGRQRLEAVWGPPEADAGLEAAGFPIRGLRFGRVVLLIQPERGYDRDPASATTAPTCPHTTPTWPSTSGCGRSSPPRWWCTWASTATWSGCRARGWGFPPGVFRSGPWARSPSLSFIVNDPGEGSQAKRRAQAVILDHLTPPLGRAGLHGELQRLEALLDEYWEASQLGAERLATVREQLAGCLEPLALPAAEGGGAAAGSRDALEQRIEAADGYLCELKEAQIRLGLHTYGTLPPPDRLLELLLCLARAPQERRPGLTQALARDLDLELDPWADPEEQPLPEGDRPRLAALARQLGAGGVLRRVGDGVALLEQAALALLAEAGSSAWGPASAEALAWVNRELRPRLLACGEAERTAFLAGLAGERIAAGPSGAPTRGRPDLLPTGRNFYSVDLRGLPTEAAWDLGRRSAALLLELHLQEEGDHLRSLALSVWGTATMRNGGEDIAQALALLGVQPVWDGPTRRMVDLEVLPLAALGRPAWM